MIDYLSGLEPKALTKALDGLSSNALVSLPWLFEFWALQGHQLAPVGDWTTWVILGGRGAGKTRAGAEWVRQQVEGAKPLDKGRCRRVALVGETIEQARDVMVFGDNPGNWTLHDHNTQHVRNNGIYPGGMLTMLQYEGFESPYQPSITIDQ